MTLTYADRQKLHIRTIGSVNVKKRARTELRKRSKREPGDDADLVLVLDLDSGTLARRDNPRGYWPRP